MLLQQRCSATDQWIIARADPIVAPFLINPGLCIVLTNRPDVVAYEFKALRCFAASADFFTFSVTCLDDIEQFGIVALTFLSPSLLDQDVIAT